MNCSCRTSIPNEQVSPKLALVTPSCVAGLFGDHAEKTGPLPGMLKHEDTDIPYKIRGVRIHVC